MADMRFNVALNANHRASIHAVKGLTNHNYNLIRSIIITVLFKNLAKANF